jgi:hypothetical protein
MYIYTMRHNLFPIWVEEGVVVVEEEEEEESNPSSKKMTNLLPPLSPLPLCSATLQLCCTKGVKYTGGITARIASMQKIIFWVMISCVGIRV